MQLGQLQLGQGERDAAWGYLRAQQGLQGVLGRQGRDPLTLVLVNHEAALGDEVAHDLVHLLESGVGGEVAVDALHCERLG